MAARIFVPFDLRQRQRRAPELRHVDEGGDVEPVKRRGADANMRASERAAVKAARQQQMASLHPKEGDGRVRLDRGAAHGAGGAVDAARNVDADDILAACAPPTVEALNQRAGVGVEIAREPGAEQGVDDEIGPLEFAFERRTHRARPGGRRARRIAAQLLDRRQRRDAHLIALRFQQSRRDETIAAIIARAAKHQHAPPACALQNLTRHSGQGDGGVLHQPHARNPALDRQAIGAGHLVGGEQFEREGAGHGAMVTEGRRLRNGRRAIAQPRRSFIWRRIPPRPCFRYVCDYADRRAPRL